MRIRFLILILFATSPICASPVSSEVISAQATIFGGGFDFSRGDCGCPPCLVHPFGSIPYGDVPLDSIDAAPTAGYYDHIGEDINEMLQLDHTYVVRTREGGHAAFRVIASNPRQFDLDD